MSEFFTLAESIGIFSVAAVMISWLIRSLGSRIFDRDLERFRHSLMVEAQEHHVRFARIHEKEAEVLEMYYNHLKAARDCVAALKSSDPKSITERDRVAAQVALRACLHAALHRREYELYFRSNITEKAKALESEILRYASFSWAMMEELKTAIEKYDPDQSIGLEIREQIDGAIKSGLKELESGITPLMDDIRRDFQQLLGLSHNPGISSSIRSFLPT